MACVTITITNHTAAAVDLYTLLFQGSQTGYTVKPSGGIAPSTPIGNVGGVVSYLSVQADPANGAGSYIYKGDSNVANDGSCQGKSLGPGVVDVEQSDYNSVHLREIYVRASTDNLKVNVEVHWA